MCISATAALYFKQEIILNDVGYRITRNTRWYFFFAVSSVQTSTRGLPFADPLLIILLYYCISGLRWYLYSRLEDDRVNSAD